MNELLPPPSLRDTEAAVLSVLFNRWEGWDDQAIDEDLFYLPNHRLLFGYLSRESGEIDFKIFVEKLMREGVLDDMGGPGVIHGIYSAAFRRMVGYSENVARLREYAARRLALINAQALMAAAHDESDPDAFLEATGEPMTKIQERALNVLTERNKAKVMADIMNNFESLVRGKKSPMGWSLSLPTLSKAIRGLSAPRYAVLSGYPSSGKTLMGIQFLIDLAKQDVPSMVINLEMTTDQIISRAIATNGRFDPGILYEPLEHALRTSNSLPTRDNLAKVQRSMKQVNEMPIYFEEAVAPTIGQVLTMIRRGHKRHKVKAFAIDYLQLVRDPSAKGNKEMELTNISHALQAITKELGIFVMVLSQLNKEGGTKYATTTTEDVDYHFKIIQVSDPESEDYKKVTGLRIEKDRHTGRSGWKIPIERDENRLYFEEVETFNKQ